MNKNKPILTLNMEDSIYLAVAKNFTEGLSFVYTLACHKMKKTNRNDLFATPQIHTFRDKASARVYYDTIEQLVEINENNVKYESIFNLNKAQIENFMSHQR